MPTKANDSLSQLENDFGPCDPQPVMDDFNKQ
jgi:hypothetical protein